MNPTRKCHVQCLQFYYYHSGSPSDQLNIWIREFQDERNSIGNLHLMGQITGEENGQGHEMLRSQEKTTKITDS